LRGEGGEIVRYLDKGDEREITSLGEGKPDRRAFIYRT